MNKIAQDQVTLSLANQEDFPLMKKELQDAFWLASLMHLAMQKVDQFLLMSRLMNLFIRLRTLSIIFY